MACGFLIALASSVLLYIATFFEPVSAREALRLLLTMTIAAALIRFGNLEKRALAVD